VFLAIVVIAVLSYRFFSGPTDGISAGGGGSGGGGRSASQAPRQAPTRGGRQVTPAMVEVVSTREVQILVSNFVGGPGDVSSSSTQFNCLRSLTVGFSGNHYK
jgi:hypothetical protein